MTDKATPDRIGIDGGGTTCRIALIWRGQRHEAQTGAANVTSDLDLALAAIREGLALVSVQAGLVPDALCRLPAYAGLAGVTGPGIAHSVARGLPLDQVTVEDDRRAAVIGALGQADGAVAGVGTGSFVARQARGVVTFGGGYGLILGDEASGAWLGRALLSRVLHAADGLETPSDLTRAMQERFGHVEGIIRFAAIATPKDFAALAPDVLSATTTGDSSAVALMRAGADYLIRALDALGWQPGTPLCLLGGIAPHYASFLPTPLAKAVTDPKGTALDGALALAAEQTDRGTG